MKFSVDWDPAVEKTTDIDMYVTGDLRIDVDGVNVCAHREGDGRKRFESLFVSVYPLAEGIAMDWWRLFGNRDEWYQLKSNRGGYAIPGVRLRFDGAGFDVACGPCRYDNPGLFFPEGGGEHLSREDVERALGDFLGSVADRLDSTDAPKPDFRVQWDAVRASLRSPEEAAFCEAAGALGLDPYDMPDDAAAFIEASAELFDGEPLTEFVSGLRDSATQSEALDWVREAARRPERHSRIPAVADIREAIDGAANPALRPWARGYRCARATRHALGMASHEGVRSVSRLAERLGAPGFAAAPPVAGLAALVRSGDDGAHIHLGRAHDRSRAARAGNLFAFARAVGDAVANPPAERSVVNGLHNASRQACGRAFAAEFLAPVDEIDSMREDGLDTRAMAHDFGVSTEVVERQIENADRIREACA